MCRAQLTRPGCPLANFPGAAAPRSADARSAARQSIVYEPSPQKPLPAPWGLERLGGEEFSEQGGDRGSPACRWSGIRRRSGWGPANPYPPQKGDALCVEQSHAQANPPRRSQISALIAPRDAFALRLIKMTLQCVAQFDNLAETNFRLCFANHVS